MKNKVLTVPPLWLLYILSAFPLFSENIYSPAFPDIVSTFHTTNSLVQWTLSIYILGFALGIFIWGILSDCIGRRLSMMLGILLFLVGTFFCAECQSITMMLLARFVQGFGASVGSVLTQTIARESLIVESHRHRFFSSVAMVIAISIAIGPFVGSFITEFFTWRIIFVFLFLVGVLLLTFVFNFLSETNLQHNTKKINIIKLSKNLLCDSELLKCILLVAIINGILFSYYAESPFIFIKILGMSQFHYGLTGIIIAISASLGCLLSKVLIKLYSIKSLLKFGSIVLTLSCFLLFICISLDYLYGFSASLLSFVILLAICGVIFSGFGFILPFTLSMALQKYDKVYGTAGSIFGLFYYVVIAALNWFMGFIHNGSIFPMAVYFLLLSIITFCIIWHKPNDTDKSLMTYTERVA